MGTVEFGVLAACCFFRGRDGPVLGLLGCGKDGLQPGDKVQPQARPWTCEKGGLLGPPCQPRRSV